MPAVRADGTPEQACKLTVPSGARPRSRGGRREATRQRVDHNFKSYASGAIMPGTGGPEGDDPEAGPCQSSVNRAGNPLDGCTGDT